MRSVRGAVRGKEDLLPASIPALGLGAPCAELERGGVDLHQPLREQPWGRETAAEIYDQARPGYHPLAVSTLDALVADKQHP